MCKVISCVLALLLLPVAGVHAAGGRDILLICNKSDDTVSFVDTATLTVLGSTTTGRGPHEIAVTPDGKWAFAANYEALESSISLIDVRAMKEVRRIPISPYRNPHGIAVSRDGKRLYATCEGSQAVIELNIAAETVTRSIETGQRVSHMLVLTPDERKMYVANIGSGTVTAGMPSYPARRRMRSRSSMSRAARS